MTYSRPHYKYDIQRNKARSLAWPGDVFPRGMKPKLLLEYPDTIVNTGMHYSS